MILNNFNFAEPLWLLVLLLIPAGWLWHRYGSRFGKQQLGSLEQFVDQKLLPHLLISASQHKAKSSAYGWMYAALVACFALALANPRWDYKEIDAYAPTASMVMLMDLGSSMSAEDVSPSRIVRARQRVEDLLNQSRGLKVGLIGFAAIPHLITPITDDIQTVKGFLPAIDTSLITKQGDSLKLALQAAEELLDSEPGEKKSILLISDGNFADIDYSQQLKDLINKKINVQVMAVGTLAGATYRDKHDKIVTSKLNQEKLQTIAQQGNGIYVDASYSEAGIAEILAKVQQQDVSKQVVTGKVKQWEDRYYVVLLPAILLLLYLMSQRVFYTLFLVVSLGMFTSNEAQAFELGALFKNSAQQGQEQYAQDNFAGAASSFSDPYHKGVALYRNGDFAAAEQQFNAGQRDSVRVAAMYNAGNAQMQQKKWRAAINSYETVLKSEPDNLDAKHNLELAKKMLAEDDQDEDKKDKDSDCECDKKNKDKQQGKDKDQAKDQDQGKDQDQNQNKDKDKDQKQDQDKEQDQKQNEQPQDQQQAPQQDDQTQAQNDIQDAEQEARAQQWLNRIDSDIKVFLKNKFYIEDRLSSK